jgi:hypothetical protein
MVLSPGVFAAVSDLGLHQGSFVPESEESLCSFAWQRAHNCHIEGTGDHPIYVVIMVVVYKINGSPSYVREIYDVYGSMTRASNEIFVWVGLAPVGAWYVA